MTISIVGGVNPLQTTLLVRGIVSGRVALLLRSAEIQPLYGRFVQNSFIEKMDFNAYLFSIDTPLNKSTTQTQSKHPSSLLAEAVVLGVGAGVARRRKFAQVPGGCQRGGEGEREAAAAMARLPSLRRAPRGSSSARRAWRWRPHGCQLAATPIIARGMCVTSWYRGDAGGGAGAFLFPFYTSSF